MKLQRISLISPYVFLALCHLLRIWELRIGLHFGPMTFLPHYAPEVAAIFLFGLLARIYGNTFVLWLLYGAAGISLCCLMPAFYVPMIVLLLSPLIFGFYFTELALIARRRP